MEGVTFRAYTDTGEIVAVETPANADPWGEYFRRLNNLVQFGYLKLHEFAKEAKGFLGKRQITDGMIDPLAELADRLPYGPDYELFANAVISYCKANPATPACGHIGPRALAVQYSRKPGQK